MGAPPGRELRHGVKYLRHPELGKIELEFQALNLPDDSGQRILTYTGEALSSSANSDRVGRL